MAADAYRALSRSVIRLAEKTKPPIRLDEGLRTEGGPAQYNTTFLVMAWPFVIRLR